MFMSLKIEIFIIQVVITFLQRYIDNVVLVQVSCWENWLLSHRFTNPLHFYFLGENSINLIHFAHNYYNYTPHLCIITIMHLGLFVHLLVNRYLF